MVVGLGLIASGGCLFLAALLRLGANLSHRCRTPSRMGR